MKITDGGGLYGFLRGEYRVVICSIYGLITIVLLSVLGFLTVRREQQRPARILRFIAMNTFGQVLYQTVEGGRKKLYFLDREVTDGGTANRIFVGLAALAMLVLNYVFTVFFIMLLLEGSFECTKEFDCFDYDSNDNEPLNCSSEVVLNGTMHIICYRYAFNYVVATGAAYGLFKVDVFAVYLFSMFLLWLMKKVNEFGICGTFCVFLAIEVIVVGPLLGFSQLISSPSYYKIFPPMEKLQYWLSLTILAVSLLLLFYAVPWSKLAEIEEPFDDGVGIAGSEGFTQGNENVQGFDNMAQMQFEEGRRKEEREEK